MTKTQLGGAHFEDPVSTYLANPEKAVLAIISGVDGPSYRPLGASMTVLEEKNWVGTLSSGCIEADIALHAMQAKQDGTPRPVKYGRGSPYIDIQLPCGGGLEILLLPNPDIEVLKALKAKQDVRIPCSVRIDVQSGDMSLEDIGQTSRAGDILTIRFEPEPRFLVFGKGPEACTFTTLVQAAGYPNLLLSPDEETLQCATAAGCTTRHLTSTKFPPDLQVDHRSAIVLFFHDHDWEPEILKGALATNACYIGAQGSRAAQALRHATMKTLGVTESDLGRLTGPIGLIPSARDARTLAVSVLSEILAKLKEQDE